MMDDAALLHCWTSEWQELLGSGKRHFLLPLCTARYCCIPGLATIVMP